MIGGTTESNSFAQMTENSPLYRMIADTLRREIVSGGYAVGRSLSEGV